MGFLDSIIGQKGQRKDVLSRLIPAGVSAVGEYINKSRGDNTSGTSESTRSGTSTTTESMGPEAKALLEKLMPQIMQMSKRGSVDSGYADKIAQQQTMGANQSADAIRDTLTGNAAGRGLTYSAPAGMARGVAESFRGSAFNNILQNQAQSNMDISRGNRAETDRATGLASNILNILPGSKTSTDNTTITGQNSINSGGGSWLGNALEMGGDLFGALSADNKNNPPRFTMPAGGERKPGQTPALGTAGIPTLSDAVPQGAFSPELSSMLKKKNPLAGKEFIGSSISYDFGV
jgi:hypothetical protein